MFGLQIPPAAHYTVICSTVHLAWYDVGVDIAIPCLFASSYSCWRVCYLYMHLVGKTCSTVEPWLDSGRLTLVTAWFTCCGLVMVMWWMYFGALHLVHVCMTVPTEHSNHIALFTFNSMCIFQLHCLISLVLSTVDVKVFWHLFLWQSTISAANHSLTETPKSTLCWLWLDVNCRWSWTRRHGRRQRPSAFVVLCSNEAMTCVFIGNLWCDIPGQTVTGTTSFSRWAFIIALFHLHMLRPYFTFTECSSSYKGKWTRTVRTDTCYN